MRRAAVFVAIAAALALPASAPAAELGLNINGGVAGGSRVAFDDMGQLGPKWARHFLFWDDIDDSGLKLYESMAAQEQQLGIKTLLVVASARRQQPADKQAYADFMGRLAARLKGQVEAYEVWNEADESGFWNGGPQPAAYVDVLRRSHDAIKAADPAAKVVFTPTTGNNYKFLADAYKVGAKGNFDVMAVHTDTACLDVPPDYYYRESDGRQGRFTFLAYREVRKTMLDNGDDKPIWMTEFGWSAAQHQCEHGESAGRKPAGVSEADQAKYMLQALNCMEQDSYLEAALWFNNRDLSGDGKMDNMYGLRRFDGATRPAFDAFKTWASGGGRANADCGDFDGPGVQILQPAPDAVLPPGSPLYIRAKSGAGDLRRIRFRIAGQQGLFPDGLKTMGPEPNGEAEITWREAAELPVGTHTLEVFAFDESGNPGPAEHLQFTKVAASARGGAGIAAAFPKVTLSGRGRNRTLQGGALPVLGGGLRIEWYTQRKRGKRRPWKRVHAVTKIARRPWVAPQRLKFGGRWRIRLVFLGKLPHRRTVSCWIYFSTNSTSISYQCPRGAVAFPS